VKGSDVFKQEPKELSFCRSTPSTIRSLSFLSFSRSRPESALTVSMLKAKVLEEVISFLEKISAERVNIRPLELLSVISFWSYFQLVSQLSS